MEKRNSDLKLIEDMAEKLQNDSKQFAFQTRNIKRIEKHCVPYDHDKQPSKKETLLSKCKNFHSTLKSKMVKLKSKERSKVGVFSVNKTCETIKDLTCGKANFNFEGAQYMKNYII